MSISSESFSQKNSLNKEKSFKEFLVHLTILTEIIPKSSIGDTCICKNHVNITQESKSKIFTEVEIIPSVKVPLIPIEPQNSDNSNDTEQKEQLIQIKVCDLCNSLRQLGYPLTGSMINLYLKDVNDFVFYGTDPIDSNVFVDSEQINFNCIRMKIINYIDEKLIKKKDKKNEEEDEFDYDEEEEDEISVNEGQRGKKKERRTKERKIGFIIEKVNAWRKLYNGFYNENGEHTRYSLDQAAKLINISKKSLDDYLLQLRLGRKYGFDFNKHRNTRVGELRDFVKKHRENKKK